MIALYNEFNSQGLEIISISLDSDKSEWPEALKKTVTMALSRFRTKIIAINLKGESLKQKIKELME